MLFGSLSRIEQSSDVYAMQPVAVSNRNPETFSIVRAPDYRYKKGFASSLIWIHATQLTNERVGRLRLIRPLWNPRWNSGRCL